MELPTRKPETAAAANVSSPTPGEELTAQQTAALDALVAGKTITDAAAAAGVSRTTLYDWMRRNFAFQANLNRRRRELQQAVGHCLETIAAEAAQCVATAVREGNVKVAMEILKNMNALGQRAIGSDDPCVLEYEEEETAMKLRDRLLLARYRK